VRHNKEVKLKCILNTEFKSADGRPKKKKKHPEMIGSSTSGWREREWFMGIIPQVFL
jgi:hypothetical protein